MPPPIFDFAATLPSEKAEPLPSPKATPFNGLMNASPRRNLCLLAGEALFREGRFCCCTAKKEEE
jgi:hypothetical protein